MTRDQYQFDAASYDALARIGASWAEAQHVLHGAERRLRRHAGTTGLVMAAPSVRGGGRVLVIELVETASDVYRVTGALWAGERVAREVIELLGDSDDDE